VLLTSELFVQFDVKNDLANLLLLLQELREKIGDDKILSMDTSSGVYNGPDGNPSSDMSEFGKVLDFITIMVRSSLSLYRWTRVRLIPTLYP